ncbi:MAG: hypothetical protein ACLBM4_21160 [Dolichospermum sp.]|jgi:hypothetical protein
MSKNHKLLEKGKLKMESLRLRSRIGKDGLLKIHLPQAKEGTEFDIIVIYEIAVPKEETATQQTMKLSDFYGCIQDETFIRHPQLEQPEREAF